MANYFEMHPTCKHVEIDWECRETRKNTQEARQIAEYITTHEYAKVCKELGLQYWDRMSRGFEIVWNSNYTAKNVHHVEFGDDKVENAQSFIEKALDEWDRMNAEEEARWA